MAFGVGQPQCRCWAGRPTLHWAGLAASSWAVSRLLDEAGTGCAGSPPRAGQGPGQEQEPQRVAQRGQEPQRVALPRLARLE